MTYKQGFNELKNRTTGIKTADLVQIVQQVQATKIDKITFFERFISCKQPKEIAEKYGISTGTVTNRTNRVINATLEILNAYQLDTTEQIIDFIRKNQIQNKFYK